MSQTKNQKSFEEKLDRMKEYSLGDAISLLKDLSFAKFDETIELSIGLGVDPRHADQNIRVTASLPSGTGKEVKVLVITQGPKEKEAEEAGSDFVGNKEYLEKIKSGWAEIDTIIATPDMMPELGKLGKVLGPKGLMPNPKSGTVTMDVAKAVQEIKSGKIEIRLDKFGIAHVICGKMSFENDALADNIKKIYETIIKARPAAVKGTYLKKITLSSSMGPGIKLDKSKIR
ncbi:MAG: 50S ribosomal protein L1 [Candidatus Marinimicrobia bacterium]|jgi:large subunit ribosomal protein L1|nr:50S ribosomal protein L1 [Candidatus Neomarinimicrobiota bacterium]MBT3617245.1 50S ribosomal protein L1 [Candidatus Neomarinimicrobiota bacterium]MBT3829721.1 50S ribosomal protein L1 [Candidatus Neomarinimicrobiota bacterium]MBT3997845.1 50S ribosomal protein L1 [Candidatus Neomarinimicrobiota bacterium]MBT4280089.1 50S ribosomal protein L1 [Candidatus Neomarinimicrobiota bacterium]